MAPLCKLHLVAASCCQMVLTRCNLRWWCFLPSSSTNTPLALMVVITHFESKWYLIKILCILEKCHQRKLLKVGGTGHQHPSAQVGAGCSNNMQLAHGHSYMQVSMPCTSPLQSTTTRCVFGHDLGQPSSRAFRGRTLGEPRNRPFEASCATPYLFA